MSQFSHLFTLNDPGLFINIALVLLFVILTTSISTPYTLLDARIRLAQERDFRWFYDTHFFYPAVILICLSLFSLLPCIE